MAHAWKGAPRKGDDSSWYKGKGDSWNSTSWKGRQGDATRWPPSHQNQWSWSDGSWHKGGKGWNQAPDRYRQPHYLPGKGATQWSDDDRQAWDDPQEWDSWNDAKSRGKQKDINANKAGGWRNFTQQDYAGYARTAQTGYRTPSPPQGSRL